jgi:hypothetical protein
VGSPTLTTSATLITTNVPAIAIPRQIADNKGNNYINGTYRNCY